MLGTYGLHKFIVDNDLDIFQKFIPGQIKQIFKQNNKITLLRLNFKLNNYTKLTQKELNSLSSTAQHFLKFLYDFGTYKKIKNMVKVVTVDENLQNFDRLLWTLSNICLIFGCDDPTSNPSHGH